MDADTIATIFFIVAWLPYMMWLLFFTRIRGELKILIGLTSIIAALAFIVAVYPYLLVEQAGEISYVTTRTIDNKTVNVTVTTPYMRPTPYGSALYVAAAAVWITGVAAFMVWSLIYYLRAGFGAGRIRVRR